MPLNQSKNLSTHSGRRDIVLVPLLATPIRLYNYFIINKFGKSKFNGNYVSPRRHAMHDTYRHINNVKPFPSIARQLDRVPRVYYGTIIGGVYGKLSTYNVDSNDK